MNKKILLLISLISSIGIYGEPLQYYAQEVERGIQERNLDRILENLNILHELEPTNKSILLQLARYNFFSFEFKKTCEYYETYLKHYPPTVDLLYNLASAYNKRGKFDRAQYIFQKLPQDDQIKSELLKLYLRNSYWNQAEKIFTQTNWHDFQGKTILFDCDKPGNGFGDIFQFLRVAVIAKNRGAQIIVKTPKALQKLLKLCPSIDQVITSNDPTPHIDQIYPICIGSLILNTKNNFPLYRCCPYLFPDPYLVQKWRNTISDDHNMKIGICWESNLVRNKFTRKKLLSHRSIPLELMERILKNQNISFYSLQKDPHTKSNRITFMDNFDQEHGRFMDTAAFMHSLDLVITIDSSIAHLAGAQGIPVWLLLPAESDYRWFKDRSDSPWYPTMRIFRQPVEGDWNIVIDEINNALQKIVKK